MISTGVSNFDIPKMEELLLYKEYDPTTNITLDAHQLEVHPWFRFTSRTISSLAGTVQNHTGPTTSISVPFGRYIQRVL